MKKTFLLASVTMISLQAVAQQSTTPFFGKAKSKHGQLTRQLLRLQESGIKAEKPTAEKQRVIAQAFLIPGPVGEYDSTRYTYTGTNGSEFDYNNADYMYIDHFSNSYAPMFIRPYETTSQKVLADSMLHYDDEGLTGADKAYYRSDKKIDSVLSASGSSTITRNKTVNTYDAAGHLIASYQLNRSTSSDPWDTSSYRHYSYNSTFTQMSRDSVWVKVMTSMSLREDNVYHYSAAGKLDSIVTWDAETSTPVRENAVRITYNSDGKIATIREYRFDDIDGEFQTYADSLGYTPGVDFYTFHDTYSYEADTLADGQREVRFFTANRLDSVQLYATTGVSIPWERMGKLTATYNSHNNPEKMVASFMGINVTMRFYYETYDDQTSSVKPLSANQDFTVYPNPFANTINIDWKGRQQSDATVRLVNIMGQEVFHGKMVLKSGQNKLDIPAVADGSYVLLIQDAAGKSWSTKMIKR